MKRAFVSVLAIAGAVVVAGVVDGAGKPEPPRFGRAVGQPQDMVVEGHHSSRLGRLSSNRILDGGTRIVPHGLTVEWSPAGMYRASIFDDGRLVSVRDYWPASGLSMREINVDPRGNGRVQVSHFDPKHEPLAVGELKGGKRWSGRFLEVRMKPQSFGVSEMMWTEYADGTEKSSKPASLQEFGIPDEHFEAHQKDPKTVATPWREFFERFEFQTWDASLREMEAPAAG